MVWRLPTMVHGLTIWCCHSCRLKLHAGLDAWPGNAHMLQGKLKKKKKKKTNKNNGFSRLWGIAWYRSKMLGVRVTQSSGWIKILASLAGWLLTNSLLLWDSISLCKRGVCGNRMTHWSLPRKGVAELRCKPKGLWTQALDLSLNYIVRHFSVICKGPAASQPPFGVLDTIMQEQD